MSTSTTSVSLCRAGPDDVAPLARLVAETFHPLELSAWLVPDRVERAGVLPRWLGILIDYGLRHGQVDVIAGRTGVAVWLPLGSASPPSSSNYDRRLGLACGSHTDRFRVLDEYLDVHHPPVPDHHHLALLAVYPEMQGAGLGTELLAHHLRQLDTKRIPAYAAAWCPRSGALFARHGYQARPPFSLPGGPAVYPMWRCPR